MNAKLGELSEFYKKQVLSKDAEIRKLLDYIKQLEESESSVRHEFARQLSEKDREITKSLGLSSSGERGKDRIEGMYARQLRSKDGEIEKLRAQLSQIKGSGAIVSDELSGEVAQKDAQIRRMIHLVRSKDEENSRLAAQLEESARTEREYVERIKNAIARKGRSTTEMVQKLTDELDRKNAEVSRLRNVLLSQEKVSRQLDNQALQDRKRMDYLEAFLQEKDLLREKLEQSFSIKLREKERELENLSRDLRMQLSRHDTARLSEELAALKARLNVKESELNDLTAHYAELKEQNGAFAKRLQERQRLFTESEATYSKLMGAMQQQHESRIREILHKHAESDAQLKSEIERLKSELSEKDSVVSEKSTQIDATLLQFAETARKLIELKGPEFTQATASAELLKRKDEALAKRESELNLLLRQAADRVRNALRKEAEVAKREALLVKEQEALNAELEVLKGAGIAIGKEKEYLKEKIGEYDVEKQQPQPAEFEIVQPVQAEAQIFEPKQEPSKTVPETIDETIIAPASTGDEKEDVLSILRRAPKSGQPKARAVELLQPARKPVERKGVFKQAKARSKILPKPSSPSFRAKVERPKIKEALVKQAGTLDSFPAAEGYSELDEIRSIISIGLQHGDTIEQIKSSLESSGYSKKNVDKALLETKKV